jgi:outer membrane protein
MRFFLFFFFFFSFLHAANMDDKKISMRLGYGVADINNLGYILVGDHQRYEEDTALINLDTGYRISQQFNDWPLDIYVKGSLSYFKEKDVLNYETGKESEDFLEAVVYIKAYLNLDFSDNRLRIGVGEGLSFAKEVPIVEVYDALQQDGIGPTSKILNYLDVSFDIDVGRLFSVDALRDTYLGYTIKHRSGIFGLFNGVKGGSNYNMITIEKNF